MKNMSSFKTDSNPCALLAISTTGMNCDVNGYGEDNSDYKKIKNKVSYRAQAVACPILTMIDNNHLDPKYVFVLDHIFTSFAISHPQ